jgi:hypothetical protein
MDREYEDLLRSVLAILSGAIVHRIFVTSDIKFKNWRDWMVEPYHPLWYLKDMSDGY